MTNQNVAVEESYKTIQAYNNAISFMSHGTNINKTIEGHYSVFGCCHQGGPLLWMDTLAEALDSASKESLNNNIQGKCVGSASVLCA